MMPTLRTVLCACLLACLSAVLPAAPITTAQPVEMYGSGSYHMSSVDNLWTYTLIGAGSTGADSVSFNIQTSHTAWLLHYLPSDGYNSETVIQTGAFAGWGNINGIQSSFFDFSFGGTGGRLRLYDDQDNLLAETNLQLFWKTNTHYIGVDPNDPEQGLIQGTFSATPYEPIPEPSTWALAGVSLLGVAWWRRRQYPASVQR